MNLLVLLFIAFYAEGAEPPAESAELIIRQAMIYDGTGQPGRIGDIGIRGDRIVAVASVKPTDRTRIIDGTGFAVAPGFIDLHTHCDTGPTSLSTAPGRPNRCYLMQGVTTVVTGNCGLGPVDVAEYFRRLEKAGIGTNVIHQVPHNDLRRQVMGNANRLPTEAELQKMEMLVEQGMRDGAWGFSTGLIYNPGTYAQTAEIIRLAKVAGRHGGHYASHIRDEGAGLLAALDEALTIGREAGLPVHISHFKAMGRSGPSRAADAIDLLARARQAGQAVTADQYPYTASSTSLSATLIPSAFREGSEKEYQARLADSDQLRRLRPAIQSSLERRGGGKDIRIARYVPRPAWQGKDLAAIAAREQRPAVDIVLEMEQNGGAGVVNFGMREDDVRLIMRQPFVATASDGSSQVPGDTVPHPRSYGCFPRKIGHYSLEEHLLPTEQAIRSATGLPADILRLTDRGYLKAAQKADVVVFDPRTYRERATYDRPHQYAAGVQYLFVNGQMVIEKGNFTGQLAGQVLRHPEAMPAK